MQEGQFWEYKVWPVEGLEQQIPDFCRDGVFQGQVGSSGCCSASRGVSRYKTSGVSSRSCHCCPQASSGGKTNYSSEIQSCHHHCAPWQPKVTVCTSLKDTGATAAAAMWGKLDPTLQHSAEKEKQVLIALIAFKNGLLGAEGFWGHAGQGLEQPGPVEGWGSGGAEWDELWGPFQPKYPVILGNHFHGALKGLGCSGRGCRVQA